MATTGAETKHRRRIVMLVDNAVTGDSRVQKAARSAAEHGWEVILLGEQRDPDGPTEWQLGDAKVRLVPLETQLAMPPSVFGRTLRRPLAYPPGRAAGYRVTMARARLVDLATRRATARARRMTGGGRLRELAGRPLLAFLQAGANARLLWARFRARQTQQARELGRNDTAFLNTFPIKFWRFALGRRAWRRLDPSLWHWELAFGKVIDELRPDLIHAHDFRMIGVGARATMRARAAGRDVKLVWDAHEYLPGLRPRPSKPRWLPSLVAHEREYAPFADTVVTVSADLADLLQREHRMAVRPTVVMNCPLADPSAEEHATEVPDLRKLCGIGPDTPLLAYCGGISPIRGIDTMLDAMPKLPGVHLALVSLHPTLTDSAPGQAQARAQELGVGDRVHLLPYVPHWQVAPFLAAADAAVTPLHHLPNHEIALSNKFFEYSQARLPIVTSDVRTMATTIRSTGQGEVFVAEDVDDYVRAVSAVLADPERYRAAYDRPGLLAGWTWEAQAAVLDQVYRDLLGKPAGAAVPGPRQPAATAVPVNG